MSRLQQDFNMYYHGTYIGYQAVPDGPIVPFYIEQVEWNGVQAPWSEQGVDEDDVDYEERDAYYESSEYDDYSLPAYDNLIFYGHIVTDETGRSTTKSVVGFHDPRLIFKNPLLGFVKIQINRNHVQWGTYIPTRSVKKGISSNRVNIPLNNYVLWQIFAGYDSDRAQRDFHFEESTGFIKYRHNVVIATKDPDVDTIYLDPLAAHLKEDLEGLFTECQVLMQEI